VALGDEMKTKTRAGKRKKNEVTAKQNFTTYELFFLISNSRVSFFTRSRKRESKIIAERSRKNKKAR
jgi:hypothetical protein